MCERSTPGIEGPQGIKINLPYRAYYDNNADSAAVEVTLINDQAGTVYGVA